MLANRSSVTIASIALATLLGWAACYQGGPGTDGIPNPSGTEENSFEYGLVLEDERGEGGMRPVGRDFRFRSGDGFRFAFRADFDAHVYLFNRAERAADYVALVPGPATRVANPIYAGEAVHLPGAPEWLRFDRQPGWEHFVMVVSTAPQADFEPDGNSIDRDAFERSLARIERLQTPASRSSVTEADKTREFFAASAREVALVVRLPLEHD